MLKCVLILLEKQFFYLLCSNKQIMDKKHMKFPPVTIELPKWIDEYLSKNTQDFSNTEKKMDFVIDLSRQNILNQTGGPFAAAIFEANTNTLVSIGVNLVTSQNCSVYHAEMVAIILAQHITATYDLNTASPDGFELYTSTEPCAMCMGAIFWAGLKRIICGANDADAREAGFDEGVKPENWIDKYSQKGIEIKTELLHDKARQVLLEYKKNQGLIYNSNLNS